MPRRHSGKTAKLTLGATHGSVSIALRTRYSSFLINLFSGLVQIWRNRGTEAVYDLLRPHIPE